MRLSKSVLDFEFTLITMMLLGALNSNALAACDSDNECGGSTPACVSNLCVNCNEMTDDPPCEQDHPSSCAWASNQCSNNTIPEVPQRSHIWILILVLAIATFSIRKRLVRT